MPAKRPNSLLSDLMSDAGISRKALARAVKDRSELAGEPISCDHTSVKRWLDGMAPRPQTAGWLAEVLGRRIGRTLTLADIGMPAWPAADPSTGTRYEDTPEAATETLARLWQADADDVRAIVAAPTNPASWADASLSWLVRPGRDSFGQRQSGQAVGLADVAGITATANAFSQLDNQFGGRHARQALVHFLRLELAPLLTGRYSEGVGRKLHAVAAETSLLLAWMSYDAGSHGLAQRYFTQALRLAQAADDVLLAASILDAMSHQATFLGRYREAANLARAAQTGTGAKATPALAAHFLAMEARALSGAGDRLAAERALAESQRAFAQRQPGQGPAWLDYFDEAEMAAELSHCYRDLGLTHKAASHAANALSPNGAAPRSDFFVLMVLAESQIGTGHPDEGCETAMRAFELGEGLKSARCGQYIGRFRMKLQAGAGARLVRDFEERVSATPLWVASLPKAG